MKRTGGWRGLVGATGVLAVGLAMAAVTAAPAQAHGDPGSGYQGDVKGVKVETNRTYDEAANQTTFTFTLILNEGEKQVSHVLLMACPDINIVSATGPKKGPDATPEPADSTTPQPDKSISEDHVGVKFDPGYRGVYTITFAGNISGAEFAVKDGTGHEHFTAGSDACKPVTPPTNEPPVNDPPVNDPPANDPPANDPPANNPPANNPPANSPPADPGAEVSGMSTENTPAATTEVQGVQLTAPLPQTDSTLPRTGSELALLAPLGAMLVAFGSVAIAAGRRSRV